MNIDEYLAPISEEETCGPDLFENYDPAFEAYMNDAEARLPERFFDAGGNPSVEASSIDPEAEWAPVAALLERTRDLRLLAYHAQFCALAQDLPALADCLDLMAGLLETFPEAVHPQVGDDAIDRTNALELLATPATVLMPMEFASLVRDRRHRDISLRRIAVSRGDRTPQGNETAEDAEALLGALRSAENADAVAEAHALLTRMKDAVSRIEAICLTHETMPFRPNVEGLHNRLDDLIGVLVEARPDLGGDAEVAGEDAGAEDAADVDGAAGESGDSPAAAPAAGRIETSAQARAALDALETYFRTHEPSSPSFVLVRQARQLVGRPLVEALELLVPEMSGRARIDFGQDTGFLLTMERMRALSDVAAPEDPESEDEMPDFSVSSRKDAGSLMSALESFYAAKEPSSPIPILLTRARGYLNQSFTAILAEFLPLDN
jgi:type VI secretion system protein ImpA